MLIPLDIFLIIPHNKISKLDAWLYFIASDRMEDLQNVIKSYPEFQKIYQEIFRFRYETKELVSMFSEALKILDYNTTQYMIEEQQKEIERKQRELEANMEKMLQLDQKLDEKEQELDRAAKELGKKDRELEKKDQALSEKDKEIEKLRALLSAKSGGI